MSRTSSKPLMASIAPRLTTIACPSQNQCGLKCSASTSLPARTAAVFSAGAPRGACDPQGPGPEAGLLRVRPARLGVRTGGVEAHLGPSGSLTFHPSAAGGAESSSRKTESSELRAAVPVKRSAEGREPDGENNDESD
jgi:hypothetical protein